MERLTQTFDGLCAGDNTVAYIGKHKQYDADIPIEMSTAAVREVLKKLAAYEDTGLSPEEVEDLDWRRRKEQEEKHAAMWGYGIDPERLTDIIDAEKEGRLVVLPCKVGDTVWEIGYDCKIDYEDMCSFPAPSCDECEFVKRVIVPVRVDSVTAATFLVGKIGTTAFFSFEEAEAAMKGGSEDG